MTERKESSSSLSQDPYLEVVGFDRDGSMLFGGCGIVVSGRYTKGCRVCVCVLVKNPLTGCCEWCIYVLYFRYI